jgi:hypothetical protein
MNHHEYQTTRVTSTDSEVTEKQKASKSSQEFNGYPKLLRLLPWLKFHGCFYSCFYRGLDLKTYFLLFYWQGSRLTDLKNAFTPCEFFSLDVIKCIPF